MSLKENKRTVIGFDLDDVLWDLLGAWLKRYNEITDDDVCPDDIKSWDIAQYINKGTRDMLFYVLYQNDFWETVKPKKGAQTVLKQLMADGYDVVIVTASLQANIKYKFDRLFELFPFLGYSQIVVAERKELVGVDVLVDDNPSNLCKMGSIKVLFDSPPNRWCDEKGIDAVRVRDWDELYKYIKDNFPVRG